MDCRFFRKKHGAFIDDTLPGVEMDEMRQHVHLCSACSQLDANVRRSLLLFRNLPTIQPTHGFSERLRTRLLHLPAESVAGADHVRGPSFTLFAAAAGSVISIGVMSALILGSTEAASEPPRLPAVVASAPDAGDAHADLIGTPAFVVSMSTGLPVWPLLLAEEGTLRFATAELQPAAWAPPRPQH